MEGGIKVRVVNRDEWNNFTWSHRDKVYRGDIAQYEEWKREMGILRIFWASDEKSICLLGVEEGGELKGVIRVIEAKVGFYNRKYWGVKVDRRGEIQDVYLSETKEKYLSALIQGATEIFSERNLEFHGLSEWKKSYWPIIERLGYNPYKRSVLIGWDTCGGVTKEPNDQVVIKEACERDKLKLRRIQMGSWGFFIPPDFKREDVYIAYLNREPVGSMYLNKFTGNIDFGVHVMKNFQRRRIGTSLLLKAIEHFKEKGFKEMYVVRVLRALTKVNEADAKALSFYVACGGKVIREYRGFKRKKKPLKKIIPEIKDFIRF